MRWPEWDRLYSASELGTDLPTSQTAHEQLGTRDGDSWRRAPPRDNAMARGI